MIIEIDDNQKQLIEEAIALYIGHDKQFGRYNNLEMAQEVINILNPKKEPLIKDEKIRKAVRTWAEANDIRYARKCGSLNNYTRRVVGYDALGTSYTLEFNKQLKLYGSSEKIEKESYTITELCGEEE